MVNSQLNMILAQTNIKFWYALSSLYEESVREQLLKLQKNIVRMALNEAYCVLQL